MNLIGYIRVSTGKQVNGESMDAQKARLEAYCQAHGHQLATLYSDAGHSAKSMDRPGLNDALDGLRGGEGAGLLVTKMDRLTRRVRDLDILLTTYFTDGAKFPRHLVVLDQNVDTSTAGGRLMLNVLCSVTQWEREATAERTKEVLGYMRTQGRRIGAVPYGWALGSDKGASMVPCQKEQKAIAMARSLYRGNSSLRTIAGILEGHGYLPRSGGHWNPNQIRRLLDKTRDLYCTA